MILEIDVSLNTTSLSNVNLVIKILKLMSLLAKGKSKTQPKHTRDEEPLVISNLRIMIRMS
jgi:hypothetical protein